MAAAGIPHSAALAARLSILQAPSQQAVHTVAMEMHEFGHREFLRMCRIGKVLSSGEEGCLECGELCRGRGKTVEPAGTSVVASTDIPAVE